MDIHLSKSKGMQWHEHIGADTILYFNVGGHFDVNYKTVNQT